MATNISRIVDLTLNIQAGSSAPASVDVPAILTDEVPLAGFGASNYAKLYSIGELSTVGDDFTSGTSGETYKAAAALAAVTPRIKNFYVIKRATVVAGVWDLIFSGATGTGDVITGTINGDAVSENFDTSDATTLTNLAATIQALDMVDTCVSGANKVTITFKSEVEPNIGAFTVVGGLAPTVTNTEVTPAVNAGGDYDNATGEADTNLWYCLLPTSTDQWLIEALAAKVESAPDRKLMIAHSTDAAIYTAGSTDVASRLNANSYRRSAVMYHDDSTEYVHCRWASRCLSVEPGLVSFANKKNLSGATAAPLNSGQISIAHGKYANTYTQVANNLNVMERGTTADSSPIESIRDIDYLLSVLETTLLNNLTSRNKTPFNETGRQFLQSWGNGVVQQFSGTILDNDQTNEWIVPAVADVPALDKSARLYSGCVLNGYYLNSIIKITATVNVNVG